MLETQDKNSTLKVIDFGCSKILKENETVNDCIGTVIYIYIYMYIYIFLSL